jgi:hypothetical protein
MFDDVFDDSRRVLPITAAIGATIVVFSTVLPWYSFDVVLPAGRVTHIFAVTVTQWGFTTLAPILELAGALAVLLIAGLVPRPAANVSVALIGLAMFVYGLVRCFVVPSLGVELLPGGVPAVTRLEGGPFIELLGGGILWLGALGDLLTLPAAQQGGSRLSRGWRVGRSVPPPRVG